MPPLSAVTTERVAQATPCRSSPPFGVRRGVGREQHPVAELAQGRVHRQGLFFEGIDGGAADAPLVDRPGEGFFVEHLPARGVEHDGIRLHQLELLLAEHVAGLPGEHDMERHHVRFPQKRLVVHRRDAVREELRGRT